MNGTVDELLQQVKIFYHLHELKDDIVHFYEDLGYQGEEIAIRHDWETGGGYVKIRCFSEKIPVLEIMHWQWKEACEKHQKTFLGRKLNII